MPQFNRIARITIIRKGQSFVIEDLRINISITKTEKADSNTCRVSIYNLTPHTRNQIDHDDAFLIAEAGYIDGAGPETIFRGDIVDIAYIIRKPDTITAIDVKDGFSSVRNKRLALSYDSGVTTNTLLQRAAKGLGLPIKNLPTLSGVANKVFNQGYTFGGLVSDLLDNITNDADLRWSVQNNELKVYEENGSDTSTVVLLRPPPGSILGSPEEIKIQRGKKKQKQAGFRVISLLQPLIEPGGRVSIESMLIQRAIFKVISVRHVVDNTVGDAQTITEVIQ